MMTRHKGKLMKTRIAVIAVMILSLGTVGISGASPHRPYVLGKATSCRVSYRKSTLTHVVRRDGKRLRVRYVACVYVAPKPVVTTVVTTTTLADPPTFVSVSSSESPAIVGDTITYTMVVADVLTSTLGQVYMLDNGVKLTNCAGPTAQSNGSLAYVCTEVYSLADVGPHLIVGVFLGDAVYAQSAGSLAVSVDLTAPVMTTAPTTTTSPPPTTTTTQAPPPTTTTTVYTPPQTTTKVSFSLVSSSPVVYSYGPGTKYSLELSATVTDSNGTVFPAAGAISFNINGIGVITTTKPGQTTCALSIIDPEPSTLVAPMFYMSDCTTPPGYVCSFAYGCVIQHVSSFPAVVGTGEFDGTSVDVDSRGSASLALPGQS